MACTSVLKTDTAVCRHLEPVKQIPPSYNWIIRRD